MQKLGWGGYAQCDDQARMLAEANQAQQAKEDAGIKAGASALAFIPFAGPVAANMIIDGLTLTRTLQKFHSTTVSNQVVFDVCEWRLVYGEVQGLFTLTKSDAQMSGRAECEHVSRSVAMRVTHGHFRYQWDSRVKT